MADSDTEFKELSVHVRACAEMQVTPLVTPVGSLSFHTTSSHIDPNLDPSLSSQTSLGPHSREEFEERPGIEDIDMQIDMERNSAPHKPLFTAQTLTAKSDVEAEQFLQMLQMSDIIELIANDLTGKYCLPDIVKKTTQDYTSAAILAPNIQAYKALGLVAAVIIVIHNLGVQDLPPQHETGQCAVLESVIAKVLMDMRCYVKAQIGSSIADQKENCNGIIILTNSSIGTTKAQSMLALQMWLAFLQEMYIKSGAHTNSNVDFWKFVNEWLVKIRVKFLLGMCQLGQDRLHKRRSVECMSFGKAISNITLELKPLSWIAERSPQRTWSG
ncbi:hypothetical protein EV421DRAFT_1729456 [Armillaria borealis]|uniref:Uncharacterized protein n=1 Tax=Armillaria borealis TaxID=47425 RepID=A0AA39N3U3_9AGAR|nr:hypothetical protein EV421DRAFT_1729456 [Armillaria borealis]